MKSLNRNTLRVAALAGALLAATSAGLANEVQPQEVHDASRVVAVGGSITEIVYALGEEGRLIARDSTSVFPDAALKLPDVGYMRALSPEGVLSVDPTLILALEGSGPPEAVEVLRKASVPMVTVPEKFDREGILEKIRIVGETLDVEEKARALADDVDKDIQAAEKATGSIESRRKVLFVISMQGGRIMASGTGTAADGIIRMAGGDNVISDFSGYKQLTDEAVISAAPEIILMMDRGASLDAPNQELLSHPAIAPTPAGKDGKVIRMDGAYLLGFGPRTAAAVRDLSAALYGETIQN
ncbi:ABC transporter substrate-binding protein [Aquamicrobium sp. LC103]|uniref:heme/hemin ABC transporter substrate-binding protein n=1 Tax=Aquamicrobium sp. LC103 TaxID=1120658 RepID=UPI00063E7F22|nr:ABC transporter substrate-binding protein [Aquamicrobium sp. LC103]TKT79132.1 hemin ABC transporter substrate-binding protein [Aquamicrobium sp. LC103]